MLTFSSFDGSHSFHLINPMAKKRTTSRRTSARVAGDRIAAARARWGFPLAVAADLLGVTTGELEAIEAGLWPLSEQAALNYEISILAHGERGATNQQPATN